MVQALKAFRVFSWRKEKWWHGCYFHLKLIAKNLKKVNKNPKDFEARNNMLYASYYAGVAFTKAYVGYVHAISHTLGGKYNIPHPF